MIFSQQSIKQLDPEHARASGEIEKVYLVIGNGTGVGHWFIAEGETTIYFFHTVGSNPTLSDPTHCRPRGSWPSRK
jgi:hypothetical protein